MGSENNRLESMISKLRTEHMYDSIAEGQKVMLNLEKIKKHPEYNIGIDYNKQRYHDFVESNENKLFTVEYDPKHKKDPVLVCLKEDTTKPKWLFYLGDLIKVKSE